MTLNISDLALWGTFLSGLGALAALMISIIQINNNSKFNQANFWLTLRDNFNTEDRKKVHEDLRNAKWEEIVPKENKDFIKIEDYMGLFEVCERMLERKIIDEKMFVSLYEYRIYNFKSNNALLKRMLIFEYYDWKNFYNLLARLYGNTWKDLYKFLNEIGFKYNEIRTESELLEKLTPQQRMTYKMLKIKLEIDEMKK